jgi:uncharacterized membrane protein
MYRQSKSAAVVTEEEEELFSMWEHTVGASQQPRSGADDMEMADLPSKRLTAAQAAAAAATGASSSPSSSSSAAGASEAAGGGFSFHLERPRSFGQRVADSLSYHVGSWSFIITQSVVLLLWLAINATQAWAWDPYPFILLNLFLSFQAAYTGPILVMSANRQAEVDRGRASDLHEKVDHVRLSQMWTVWERLAAVEDKVDGLRADVRQLSDALKADGGSREMLTEMLSDLLRLQPVKRAGGAEGPLEQKQSAA